MISFYFGSLIVFVFRVPEVGWRFEEQLGFCLSSPNVLKVFDAYHNGLRTILRDLRFRVNAFSAVADTQKLSALLRIRSVPKLGHLVRVVLEHPTFKELPSPRGWRNPGRYTVQQLRYAGGDVYLTFHVFRRMILRPPCRSAASATRAHVPKYARLIRPCYASFHHPLFHQRQYLLIR